MGWRGLLHRRPSQQDELAQETPLSAFDAESRERLQWRQPRAFRDGWELLHGERLVARVRARGAFGDKITIEFADAAWRVKQGWTGNLELEPAAGNAKPARHRSGFWTGKVEREGQPDLKSRSGGFWHPWWELATPDEEQMLVRVRADGGFRRVGGDVELSDTARRMNDVEMLLGINWVIAVVAMRQSSHAASAGGA